MSLPETVVEWRDLTIYGTAGPGRITFRSLEGWEGVEGRQRLIERPSSDGAFDSPVFGQPKTVRIAGRVGNPAQRDAILAELGAAFALQNRERRASPLRITHAGRTLSSSARLLRYVPAATAWGSGWFDWAAEWSCADPLRYGDPTSTQTPFPVRLGGLRFPLYSDGSGVNVGALDYGRASTTGRMVLSNEGTADTWPQFQIEGPIPAEGFDIAEVGTDRRIRFSGPVAAGSVLLIDAASGTAVIDGDSDRGGQLTYRDWFPVPAGGSVEIAFIPLGSTSEAVLTGIVRPGWW